MSGCVCEQVSSCSSWGVCVDSCEGLPPTWCCCEPTVTPTPTPT